MEWHRPTYLLSFIFSITLSVPCFGGIIKKHNYKKKTLTLKLTKKESRKFRKGQKIDMRGSMRSQKTLGKITKIKGAKATVKILKGYREWDTNDTVKLSRKGNSGSSVNMSRMGRKGQPSGKISVLPEVGTSVFPVPAVGLTAGLATSSKSGIEFNIAHGERQFGETRYSTDPFGINTEIATNAATVRYKRMWGSSFYTNTGAGYRDITFKGTIAEINDASQLDLGGLESGDQLFSVTRKDFVLDMGVGNRWNNKSFTFGVDWLGALIPVAPIGSKPDQESSTTISQDASADGSDLSEDYEDYYEYDLPGVSFQAKAYFGVSF